MRADWREDITIEMARLGRECVSKIATKMASQQKGEAWIGLDDRRRDSKIKRGKDRREYRTSTHALGSKVVPRAKTQRIVAYDEARPS